MRNGLDGLISGFCVGLVDCLGLMGLVDCLGSFGLVWVCVVGFCGYDFDWFDEFLIWGFVGLVLMRFNGLRIEFKGLFVG